MKMEKELAKEYSKNFFTDKSNSRKELKKMDEIERTVEKEGDWNKFSKEVVGNLINQMLKNQGV
jgi:hypothetical protein